MDEWKKLSPVFLGGSWNHPQGPFWCLRPSEKVSLLNYGIKWWPERCCVRTHRCHCEGGLRITNCHRIFAESKGASATCPNLDKIPFSLLRHFNKNNTDWQSPDGKVPQAMALTLIHSQKTHLCLCERCGFPAYTAPLTFQRLTVFFSWVSRCTEERKKKSGIAFFKVIVALTANYHQHTDILLVPGDIRKGFTLHLLMHTQCLKKVVYNKVYIQNQAWGIVTVATKLKLYLLSSLNICISLLCNPALAAWNLQYWLAGLPSECLHRSIPAVKIDAETMRRRIIQKTNHVPRVFATVNVGIVSHCPYGLPRVDFDAVQNASSGPPAIIVIFLSVESPLKNKHNSIFCFGLVWESGASHHVLNDVDHHVVKV